MSFGGKGGPLGRGGEEGRELEFCEKSVEVSWHFGETGKETGEDGAE